MTSSQERDATQETIALHVRVGTQRVCVGQLASPQPVRFAARVGAANPLHTGSMGKLLLAFSEEREHNAACHLPASDLLEQILVWASAKHLDAHYSSRVGARCSSRTPADWPGPTATACWRLEPTDEQLGDKAHARS